ncbi:hypothetical protein AL465_012385 [Bordetella pertussis 18323]|nr:hypothetical protein AL465_012385 [Bordetella pertussis 18323]
MKSSPASNVKPLILTFTLLPSSFAKPSPSAFSIELMGWSLRTLSDIRDSLVGWALSFAQRCGRDVRS